MFTLLAWAFGMVDLSGFVWPVFELLAFEQYSYCLGALCGRHSECICTMSILPRRMCWSTNLNTFEPCPNCLSGFYGQALSHFSTLGHIVWVNDMFGHGLLCISHVHTFCAQDVVRPRILIKKIITMFEMFGRLVRSALFYQGAPFPYATCLF